LPFVNFTEEPEAVEVLMPLVEGQLRERGFDLVMGEPMEDFLWRHRVRRTDMVSAKFATLIAEELQVQGVLVGMITLYRPGDVPQVGLVTRLVAVPEATILWSSDLSLSGDDYTGVLALGTVKDIGVLADRLVDKIYSSLRPVRAVQLSPPPETPRFYELKTKKPSEVLAYLNPTADFYGLESVGVIPFRNESERRGAGDIVSTVFVSRLHNTGLFKVIEPGLIREQFLRFRVRARGEVDRLGLRPLNRNIQAQGYITGTVVTYDEGILGRLEAPPEVAIAARLLRAEDDIIVWSMHNRLRGDDYNLFLDFGRIYSIIPLVQITVDEMIQTFTSS
jgi:hypothetical protein